MFSVKLLSNGAPLHAFDSGEKNILPGSPSVPILRKDCFLNLEVYSNKKGEVRVWLEDVKELEGIFLSFSFFFFFFFFLFFFFFFFFFLPTPRQ